MFCTLCRYQCHCHLIPPTYRCLLLPTPACCFLSVHTFLHLPLPTLFCETYLVRCLHHTAHLHTHHHHRAAYCTTTIFLTFSLPTHTYMHSPMCVTLDRGLFIYLLFSPHLVSTLCISAPSIPTTYFPISCHTFVYLPPPTAVHVPTTRITTILPPHYHSILPAILPTVPGPHTAYHHTHHFLPTAPLFPFLLPATMHTPACSYCTTHTPSCLEATYHLCPHPITHTMVPTHRPTYHHSHACLPPHCIVFVPVVCPLTVPHHTPATHLFCFYTVAYNFYYTI